MAQYPDPELMNRREMQAFLKAVEDVERKAEEMRQMIRNGVKTYQLLNHIGSLGVYGQRIYKKAIAIGGTKKMGDLDALMFHYRRIEGK